MIFNSWLLTFFTYGLAFFFADAVILVFTGNDRGICPSLITAFAITWCLWADNQKKG